MASMGTYGMSVQMRRVRSSSDKLKRLQPRSDELELREKVMDQSSKMSAAVLLTSVTFPMKLGYGSPPGVL